MKRLLAIFGISAFVLIGSIIGLILSPQLLFSKEYEYKNFKIYSNESIEMEYVKIAINESLKKIKHSEIYDESYKFDIFLAHNSRYNELDNLIFGKWSVARAIDNNIIIKRKVNFDNLSVENGNNYFDLNYVLAHEAIHCLQENHYGKMKFNPFIHPPMWKLEGYPEFISRKRLQLEPEELLKKSIEQFLGLSNSNEQILQISATESTPFIYYKGKIMLAYLMNIKHMTYTEILEDKRSEEMVFKEMLVWYYGQEE